MSVVIKAENISKVYRLGDIGTGTITSDLHRFWKMKVKGEEDPFLKIGESNDRTTKGIGDVIYSLRDINFEIEQGDSVGIIGRNGAGKSTLLKLLSRVTTPSSGEIKIKGRVASLLEVGTGFHPELTGRENIFLNGAILGMRKKEIERKFDAIVDFSGVERYIDTPVKRYSSGMYVRLAFAVSAHLESEILIVDEVLAVGDAEFRKKCLGKMGEMGKAGRTVLFVSHDLSSISTLCNNAYLLTNGIIHSRGDVQDVISDYIKISDANCTSRTWASGEMPGDDIAGLISVRLIDENYQSIDKVYINQVFGIEMIYEVKKAPSKVNVGISVFSSSGQIIFGTYPKKDVVPQEAGVYRSYCWFPPDLLNDDMYTLRINAHSFYPTVAHFDIMNAITFDVIEQSKNDREIEYKDRLHGVVRPMLQWDIIPE